MDDESKETSKISAPQHPSLGIPPRSLLESIFTANSGGSAANSGGCTASLSSPTNLVSNYYPDNYPDGSAGDFRSFSQLLAGAMTVSPPAGSGGAVVGGTVNLFSECWNEKEEVMCGDNNIDRGSIGGGSYKHNRPGTLIVPPASSAGGISPLFPISPGFSPSLFFASPGPGFLTPAQSPLGISHQQALAQVTAQAAALSQQQQHQPPPPQANNFPIHHHHHLHNSNSSDRQQYLFSSSSSALPPLFTNHQSSANNFNGGGAYVDDQQQPLLPPPPPRISHPSDHRKPQQQPVYAAPVDKPADDGYNWRKYGQKQVKGSEYPRSYYKCTNPSCPAKKKVERSFDGHITEIIYKGQHNHEPPKNGRRSAAKDSGDHQINGLSICLTGGGDHGYSNMNGYHHHQGHQWATNNMAGGDDGSAQATSLQLHGPSDSEESGDHAAHKGLDDDDDDDDDNENQTCNHKRRNTGAGSYEVGAMSHKTVTEPKIIVQTRSKENLLDDGYRWRKYGQKVVKGNPNPRSYYKCTTAGCNVRKHVERSSTDSEAVITTYEGKHTHDVPAARHSSSIANAVAADTSSHDTTRQQDRFSIPFLQLKEEKIVARN